MAKGKTAAKKRTPAGRRKKRRTGRGRILFSILAVAVIIYGAAAGYLYLNQRQLIYHPTDGVLPTGERPIEITSGEAVLRGWEVNPGREHAIIYFGGNAERLENSIPDYRDLFSQHTIYFVNYRGYGESTGNPTEENLLHDAEAIYDAVSPGHENVTVIGRSLGSGVAVHLASVRPVHQLVLVTPFARLADASGSIGRFFPVGMLLRDGYMSVEKAPGVTAPTLLIIAENDEMIPRETSEALLSAFPEGIASAAVIQGAGHNDIQEYTQFFMRIRDFQITGR